MEEKRKEELTKFFTVSSAVLSVLYAACILLSLLAPLLPKFIPLLAFFSVFSYADDRTDCKGKGRGSGAYGKRQVFFRYSPYSPYSPSDAALLLQSTAFVRDSRTEFILRSLRFTSVFPSTPPCARCAG